MDARGAQQAQQRALHDGAPMGQLAFGAELVKLEQPSAWAYITDNGALWSEIDVPQQISS
jgi:hypothetical protein